MDVQYVGGSTVTCGEFKRENNMKRERIKRAFACESNTRAPWVPFVGVHAAQLIGVDAQTYLRSKDLMLKGINRAIDLYDPDGIPVSFDLQMEAEVLGCDLVWSKDNPPSVSSHPIGEGGGRTLADLSIPKATDGRIGLTLELTRDLRAEHPYVALFGVVTGPFTLALHLCGTDIFMNMFTDQQAVRDVMAFCAEVCKAMSGYYLDAGCDVIAVVDPMCSQISSDQFEEFIAEPCKDLFDHIRDLGGLSSLFVCGFAQHNIEVMCDCKPDSISIDENIPLDYVRDITLKRGISYGGNLKLTGVLLMGDEQASKRNVVECLDIAGADNRGFILAPGCDLAYATPSANLIACGQVNKDHYQQDIIRAMSVEVLTAEPLDLESYLLPDKVKVDCITLDSTGCAACQYMWEAAQRAASKFSGDVVITEHSIKTIEGLEFMRAAGVNNIPTIMIDGQIKFVSKIPPISEIEAAIEAMIKNKG